MVINKILLIILLKIIICEGKNVEKIINMLQNVDSVHVEVFYIKKVAGDNKVKKIVFSVKNRECIVKLAKVFTKDDAPILACLHEGEIAYFKKDKEVARINYLISCNQVRILIKRRGTGKVLSPEGKEIILGFIKKAKEKLSDEYIIFEPTL